MTNSRDFPFIFNPISIQGLYTIDSSRYIKENRLKNRIRQPLFWPSVELLKWKFFPDSERVIYMRCRGSHSCISPPSSNYPPLRDQPKNSNPPLSISPPPSICLYPLFLLHPLFYFHQLFHPLPTITCKNV